MPNEPLIARSARLHATAVVSAEVELGEDVVVGPYVVLEGRVRLGAGCVVRPYVHLCGPLTMGRGNIIYTGSVLGERPQHLKYNDEPTSLEIGDHNTFREHVTVHRGTSQAWTTRIGSHNFFMAHSHVAHDCQIGNRCILANGALIGGHCTLGDNVYLSGNCAVHQYIRIGRLALLSGCSATTKDIPPFIIQQNIDTVVGINVVGMRRAGMTKDQIDGVRHAYHILFRKGYVLPEALGRLDHDLAGNDAVREMVTFIRQCHRGINPIRDRGREAA
jgi:UDP-N-acetylglucosamine acyltransferase